MSDAAPPPAPDGLTPPPDAPDAAPQKKSWAHNPWLWAVLGLGVIVIGLAIWGINERSNADDAKADLKAEQSKPKTTSTDVEITAQQPTTSTQQTTETQTGTESGDDEKRIHIGVLAGTAAAFAAARKQLNESETQVEELEADVDKANDEATKAQEDADKAKEQASSASDAQKKADAEADQAEAEKRKLGAKAKAAADCAKGMLEIAAEIPKADDVEQGMQQAGEDMKAFAPKCKDSVASAGD